MVCEAEGTHWPTEKPWEKWHFYSKFNEKLFKLSNFISYETKINIVWYIRLSTEFVNNSTFSFGNEAAVDNVDDIFVVCDTTVDSNWTVSDVVGSDDGNAALDCSLSAALVTLVVKYLSILICTDVSVRFRFIVRSN